MKHKQRKIGHQHVKPFPVVEMKLYASTADGACICPGCQESSAFALQFFGSGLHDISLLLLTFSEREASSLAWERAYRLQREGKEAWFDAYPVCFSHAQGLLEMYLGESHEKMCSLFLIKVSVTGETIFLFDRNLQRDMHHASIASGHFDTIAEFRRKYDAGEGVNFGKLLS